MLLMWIELQQLSGIAPDEIRCRIRLRPTNSFQLQVRYLNTNVEK